MNKRKYSKPEIFFDDFSLSTNIAAGCEFIPIDNATECGVPYGRGKVIFTQLMTGCIDKVGADGEFNGICYHNPTDYQVFNS